MSNGNNRVDNLNYLRVRVTGDGVDITFNAISKDLPSLKDASTWTILTDDPLQKTGETFKGKPEGFDGFSVVAPTMLADTYGTLQEMAVGNKEYTVIMTYDDQNNPAETLTIPKCYVSAVKAAGGNNNGNSQTTVTFQPRGGVAENLPQLS